MKEINRILIANRGEIAIRVIRAARELGISTVAVYADLDGPDAFHCRMADRSFPLHGKELQDTYLNMDKIISVAKIAGVQAIHPGYGFLSENHLFASASEKQDLVFWIKDIQDEFGVAILLIEHDMRMVMDISDLILAINFGKPITEGKPEEVQKHPEVLKAYLGEDEVIDHAA